MVASVGTLLLYRKKDHGRAGRRLLTALVLCYWILSTPAAAVLLIRALSPEYPAVQTPADARGATAIVVLGGGMKRYRSRGVALTAGSREQSLRVLEAARVFHVLAHPWVIVSGSVGSVGATETDDMRNTLTRLGVSADRLVEERKSRNTFDHTRYIPPLLAERGVKQFVLVTSRQHMARSLGAFRTAGYDPVPTSPEFFVFDEGTLSNVIPSNAALEASTSMLYDVFALLYYRARGWA